MVKIQSYILHILFISALSSLGLKAQELDMDTVVYDFEALTVTDGLPAGMIWSIDFDSKGIMWVVTAKGFVSYDGKTVRPFNHDANDEFSIPNKEYNFILIDSDDLIWLSNFDDRLCIFDIRSEKFIDLGKIGRTITEFNDGRVFIDNGQELNSFERQDIRMLINNPSEKGIADFLSTKKTASIGNSKPNSRIVSMDSLKYWVKGDTFFRYDVSSGLQEKLLSQEVGSFDSKYRATVGASTFNLEFNTKYDMYTIN